MEIKDRRVVWDKPAYMAFNHAFNYIGKHSVTAAGKFRTEVLEATRCLSTNPEKHAPDKFKADNRGNFRAFEMYSYRIAYKFTDNEIVILRLRHVRQEPRLY